MVKGVQTLLRLNIKSDPQSVLTFRVALPLPRYATPQQRAAFYDNLIDQLDRSSGVSSSAAAGEIPFSGMDADSFSLEGQPAQLGEYRPPPTTAPLLPISGSSASRWWKDASSTIAIPRIPLPSPSSANLSPNAFGPAAALLVIA